MYITLNACASDFGCTLYICAYLRLSVFLCARSWKDRWTHCQKHLYSNFYILHSWEIWHSSLITNLYLVQNYQQDLELAFKMFDLDGDGYVCAEDLKGVMKMLGNDLSGANEFRRLPGASHHRCNGSVFAT